MGSLDFGISFGLGLVSSLHCAGMCGPVVLAYSLSSPAQSRVKLHIAYNAGRIATYSLLGAVAGAFGGGLLAVGHIAGFERKVMLFSGAAMIAFGVLMAATQVARRLKPVPASFSRVAGRLLAARGAGSKLLLGLLMGLLPCGLVYAALLKAVNAGSAAGGAGTMLAFGLGTAGTLLGIGVFSSLIGCRMRRHADSISAVSVIAVGVFLVWRWANAPGLAGVCHHAGQ